MRTTIVLLALAAGGCAQSGTITTTNAAPPVAKPKAAVAVQVKRVDGPPPDEPRREVVEEDLFGIHLVDPYRWMERKENADEVSRWLLRQGDSTRARLEAMPGRTKFRERVRELGMAQAFAKEVRRAGDLLFYFKTDKGGDLRKLVVRSKDGNERVLVDPTSMRGPEGQHVSIEHFEPSDDGQWVAYGLAEGGGEITKVRILETKTGRVLPDTLPRIWGEFPVAWRADNASFYYTQMTPESEVTDGDPMQNMRTRFHRVGDPIERDSFVLGVRAKEGPKFEPQEFPLIDTTPGSPWVIGVGAGARSERRVFVTRANQLPAAGKSPWVTIADYSDHFEDTVIHGDDLYVMTSAAAPNRRVIRISLTKPIIPSAKVIVPESADIVEGIAADAKALYVHKSHNGRSRLERITFDKGAVESIPLPFEGWIDDLSAHPQREGLTMHLQGWTQEGRYFALDTKSRSFNELALAERSGIDATNIVTDEVEATSADGTRVPLTIMRRKDIAKDGRRPTILDGYGGYGASITPSFRPYRFAWLERGGIYAVAHVRGGGEKGDAWRLAGKGPNKPKAIQDFTGCAEYLIREKYTSPSYLAATGGSAGGILIGRAITERPELFTAANIYAGEVNALRFLQGSNGANQRAEMGSPDTAEGARALYAMDAFYNVRQGVKYPAVMLGAGLNDARVSPWTSAKFGAQLRVNGTNVWMRVERDEGHGVGSTRRQRFDLFADIYAFFLQQMGDPDFRP